MQMPFDADKRGHVLPWFTEMEAMWEICNSYTMAMRDLPDIYTQ